MRSSELGVKLRENLSELALPARLRLHRTVTLTIQDLGSIGELVGAIATVGTIAYLAIQIRHATRASRIASLQATLDGGRDHTIQPILNDPEVAEIVARGMSSFEALRPVERVRFTWFVMESVLQMQNVMQLHDEGILGSLDYEAWLDYTGAILSTPGGVIVWPQASSVVSPTIRRVLDAHLEANPDHTSLLELMPVMDARTWNDDRP